MGVQGLSSLMEAHSSQVYRDVPLRDSQLVIDGGNLCYWLYFQSDLDQNHGGEYAAFEERIRKFFKALEDCQIQPYVFQDGGTDITGKKLETLRKKAEQQIQKAHTAAEMGGNERIMPPLAKQVFKQSLARLEVPLAQCFGEADREIAALASEWKCPVLSNDSDFYIFELPGGLLPTQHFQWEGEEESFIRCKSYTTSRFCTAFNIPPQGLSLGMAEYHLPSSDLKQFFTDGTAPQLLPEAVGVVPEWTRLPLTQGRLTEDILDVLLLKRVRLGIMVDPGSLPSAHMTSRPLRQVLYGLLLGPGSRMQVEEADREGLRLGSCMVRPSLQGAAQQLKLDSLDKAEHSLRHRVFLEALGVKPSRLSGLPPHLHLPVAVTCYWMQEASPTPHHRLLQALLLGLVTGETHRESAESSALQAEMTQRLDVGVAHAYNQWQACLKNAHHLNQLLSCPLPEPHIAWLYQGPLVHQLVSRLKAEKTPELLLDRKSTSIQLYRRLLAAVLEPQEATGRGDKPSP